MKNFSYLVDLILYQIYIKDYFHYTIIKIFTCNPKIKEELLIPETMKLFGNTKSKIIKDKNGGKVTHLETTEVVLVHCNIVNNDYQHDSRVLYTFV